MSYSLLPAQSNFVHIQQPGVELDVTCYQGGYGSGKTFIGSFLGIELCRKYPGIRGLAVAKTYPLLRDTTLEAYWEHFEALGFEADIDFIWKASESKMTFPRWGNSEILFRHLQEPWKLKSLNLGWIHVEEMSEITESDFLMLLSRMRQSGIPRYRLFGTTNPQATKGWIYQYFVDNPTDPEKQTEGIQYRRVLAPSTENFHLSKAYLKNMENQFDPDYYRINVLGEDGDYTAGLVCKSWSIANIEPTPYRPNMRIYLSCDFNVDPMSWVLAHRFNNEYHFFDEICIENTNIVQTVEEFANRYHTHKAGIVVTGDASGDSRNVSTPNPNQTYYKILQNELTRNGFSNHAVDIRPANPIVEQRTAAWNAMVCSASGVRRIKVDPKCKWLIYNCENLKFIPGTSVIWEPTRNQIEKDPKLKFTKHIWDAASYLIERYDPIVLNIPKNSHAKAMVKAQQFTV